MIDKKGKQRLVIVTVILLIAVGYLVFTTLPGAAYMRTIKQVQDDPKYVGTTVRVAGLVVKDSIVQKGTTYRFDIADKGREMTVVYGKNMPSTFGAGIQVIANGTLKSKGELEASEIVTKCPSKYSSKADKAK
jgi:cytochrome c-type biogenesis protein CcmE